MKKIASILLLSCLFNINQLIAQDNTVVMKIGNEKITMSEFKNTYLKNNDLSKATEKDLLEYIELYVNFRLRYAEALEIRLDTIEQLQTELKGYRTQAAKNYLTDKEVNDKLLNEVLQRMEWDVRASHIMKEVSLEAKAEDTLKAYKAIIDIRNRVLKGESFAEIATTESDDYSARDRISYEGEILQKGNKGDLGYFTVFDMIYPFESAAYNMKVGEVSMPIRTEFGYHIIYLKDKKPALGRCAASQILITYPENATAQDSAKTRETAQEAYKNLQEGMNFLVAVDKYCTDPGIKSRRGALPLFSVSRFDGNFIEKLYGLEINDITKPFETDYGIHIVKLTDRIPVSSSADIKAVIKNRILKDTRSEKSKESFVEKLKKEYKFKENKTKRNFLALEEFYTIDSTLLHGRWEAESVSSWQKPLFTIANKTYTQQDFARYLEENQNETRMPIDELVRVNYSQFVQRSIIAYEDSQLEGKYPEFANLMKEYKEGVLLYELSEQRVWKKAETDSVGLSKFYDEIKDNYLYDNRVKANIYTMKDLATFNKFRKMLSKGRTPEQAMERLNKKTQNINKENVLLSKGQNKNFDSIFCWQQWSAMFDQSKKENEVSLDYKQKHVFNSNASLEQLTFIQPLVILPPSPKPLEEVKGTIISLYQNYLEEEWIKELRSNNEVWVDKQAIISLIKNN